jgi:hypothetical protein
MENKKKTYEKPKMEEVYLIAGEAVLSSCKDGGFGICQAAGYPCPPSTPLT